MAESREPVIVGFEAFHSDGWPEVYRTVAVVIRDRDLAREAVDEAMLRAYKRWTDVSAMSNPRGWVYRVAVNWARTLPVALTKSAHPVALLTFGHPASPWVSRRLRGYSCQRVVCLL